MKYLNVNGRMYEPRELYNHLVHGMPDNQKRLIAVGLEQAHYNATQIAWMISENAAEEFGGRPSEYQITGEPLKEAQAILSITVRSYKSDTGWRKYSLDIINRMRDLLWEQGERVSGERYERHTGNTAGFQKLLSRTVDALKKYKYPNGQLAIDSAGYVWVWRKASQLKYAQTEEAYYQSGETTNEVRGRGSYRTGNGQPTVRGLDEFEQSVYELLNYYYQHRKEIDRVLTVERDHGSLD